MTRIKGGTVTNRKHKKVLKQAKGYWMARRKQIKKAKEAVLHAGQYAFAGRKRKKRDIRRQWITRVNAALKQYDVKYSAFIKDLKNAHIELDRKILAQLALDYPKTFGEIVKSTKK
ncbi:50S ribosomal protein L20 [Candidatus Woesebacteria bacterium]|nr:50S ribosomal protein L20 [Candidatus Woesebacteria bacterium]